MSYQCELKERSAQPTLIIRTRSSVEQLGQVLGQAYDTIGQYLGELGEPCAGPPFVAYHNEDMANLDIEAGCAVARELPGRGEIQAGEMPAGMVATCVHTGPYRDIGPAYDALFEWMKNNHHQPTGVAYEIYLNDPEETPPEELETLIMFPLET